MSQQSAPKDEAAAAQERVSRLIRAMNWPMANRRPLVVAPGPGAPASPLADSGSAMLVEVASAPPAADRQMERVNGELAQALERLDRERQRYRDLFQFAPVGYLVTDALGIIREVNAAAAEVLQAVADSLIDRPLSLFVAIEDLATFYGRLNAPKSGVDPEDGWAVRLRPTAGGPFDPAMRVSIEMLPSALPGELRWTVRGVSAARWTKQQARVMNADLERRVGERTSALERAMGAAEDADRRFHDLVHGLDAIVWEADVATGLFTFVSRRGQELLGYPVEQWITEPGFWIERTLPADRDFARANRARAARDGGPTEFEYRVVASDGRIVWLRESVRVVHDASGRPAELRGMMLNISKWKKAERHQHHAKNALSARLADLTYLQELGGRLTALEGLPEILDEVLSAVASLVGADRGVAMLLDRCRGELIPAAGLGLDADLLELFDGLPVGTGPHGRAAAGRQPLAIDDLGADPGSDEVAHALRARGLLAAYCTPMVSRVGDVLGVITVYFGEPYRPPDTQIHLVELYVRQAEPFVERALELRSALAAEQEKRDILAILGRELRQSLAPISRALDVAPGADPATLKQAMKVADWHVHQLAGMIDALLAPSDLGLSAGNRDAVAPTVEFNDRAASGRFPPGASRSPLEATGTSRPPTS